MEAVRSSLVRGGEVAAVDELQLEGAPKAFPGGIVIAVALATHGRNQVGLGPCRSEITRRILNAPIGVEAEIWRGIALAQSPGEGGADPGRVERLAHGPTNALAAGEVEAGGKLKPALTGLDVGDVGDPDRVGRRRVRSLGKALGSGLVAVGGSNAVAAFLTPAEASGLHASSEAVAAVVAAFFEQCLPEARAAVGLAALGMEEFDVFGPGQAFERPGAGIGLPVAPGVVAAGRNEHALAKSQKGVVGSQRMNAFKALVGGSARIPSVFFRM